MKTDAPLSGFLRAFELTLLYSVCEFPSYIPLIPQLQIRYACFGIDQETDMVNLGINQS